MAVDGPKISESLQYLACALAALNPAPWEKVKKLSRLCPACPDSLSDAFILDKRGSDGILALGLFELRSNLQYKEKIMPYLLDVLKGLALAKWIETREPALQSESPLAGEFTFSFVTLMSGLAAKDNSLEGDIVELQLNLFNTLVDQCCAYKNLTDNKKVYFCRTTVPLLLGVAQALGVSRAYVSDTSLINKSLFPIRTGRATPKEPQLPRVLHCASPRQFLSFPQGNRDSSYRLSNAQISGVISKVESLINVEVLQGLDVVLSDCIHAGMLFHRFPFQSFSEAVILSMVTMLRDLCQNTPGISLVVSRKAHELGKVVFTTVKTEFQKKSEISTTSIYWKLQTVSSCVDLMVWTLEQDDQEGDNLCENIAEFLCSNLAVSLTLSDSGHFILCCLEGLATLSEKFPSLASHVLNSMKDFLLGPAPLLVNLSASAKKPLASIVMKVSSDSSDGGVTVGLSSGVQQDSQNNTYQNVHKVALDSICRALKSGQTVDENCIQAFLASVANRLYISESSDSNSTLISTSAIIILGHVAFTLHDFPKTTESVLTILQQRFCHPPSSLDPLIVEQLGNLILSGSVGTSRPLLPVIAN